MLVGHGVATALGVGSRVVDLENARRRLLLEPLPCVAGSDPRATGELIGCRGPVGRQRAIQAKPLAQIDVEELEGADGLLEEAPDERLPVERPLQIRLDRLRGHLVASIGSLAGSEPALILARRRKAAFFSPRIRRTLPSSTGSPTDCAQRTRSRVRPSTASRSAIAATGQSGNGEPPADVLVGLPVDDLLDRGEPAGHAWAWCPTPRRPPATFPRSSGPSQRRPQRRRGQVRPRQPTGSAATSRRGRGAVWRSVGSSRRTPLSACQRASRSSVHVDDSSEVLDRLLGRRQPSPPGRRRGRERRVGE